MSNQDLSSQPTSKPVKMKHDGVTPDGGTHSDDVAPAAGVSRVVRLATGQTPAEKKAARPQIKCAGTYIVKAFRIALPCLDADAKKKDPTLHHEYAHRGDIVELSQEDAYSLLVADAIETQEDAERRGMLERRKAELMAQIAEMQVA